jgi:hypothetical protein
MALKQSMVLDTLVKNGKFAYATSEVVPRLTAAIIGREKQGKTHFALTAPGPIAVFDADYGLEGVVGKFTSIKKVLVYRIDMPYPESKTAGKEASDIWDQVHDAFDEVLRNPEIRTVVFDTASELWEIARLAYLGKLEQVKPIHYGQVNAAFRRFLKKGLDSDKNILLIQKMKAEYINDSRTGDYEMAGFGDTPHIVQALIYPSHARKSETFEDGTPITKGDFYVRVHESRHNPGLDDTYLIGPMATFPFVASSLIEGTLPEMFE